MFVRQNETWLQMLFSFRGSGLHRTFPRIAIFTAFSLFVTAAAHYTNIEHYSLTPTPFTLIGLALGIFLGFRNNVAYDRYWEARRLWGGLVNTSRTLARQTLILVNHDSRASPELEATVPVLRQELIYRIIGHAYLLRDSLRDQPPTPEARRWVPTRDLPIVDRYQNAPQAVLVVVGEQLRDAWRRGLIADVHLPLLENSLKDLTDIQGGCERIKNTPFPHVYSVLLHQIAAFYCLFLPLGIVGAVGLMTPLVVMLISHAFLGLDEIGDEIEQPFGLEPNHLPLSALCRTIEINLRQTLGETDLPGPLPPVREILQ